jgi:hypothetical protein
MDELDTSPGVVRDTERDLDDVKHGVHLRVCTSRLGLTWSSAQTMRSWSTAKDLPMRTSSVASTSIHPKSNPYTRYWKRQEVFLHRKLQ